MRFPHLRFAGGRTLRGDFFNLLSGMKAVAPLAAVSGALLVIITGSICPDMRNPDKGCLLPVDQEVGGSSPPAVPKRLNSLVNCAGVGRLHRKLRECIVWDSAR